MSLNVNVVFGEIWRQYVNSNINSSHISDYSACIFCGDDTGWYKNVFIFFRLEVTYCFFLPLKGCEF